MKCRPLLGQTWSQITDAKEVLRILTENMASWESSPYFKVLKKHLQARLAQEQYGYLKIVDGYTESNSQMKKCRKVGWLHQIKFYWSHTHG